MQTGSNGKVVLITGATGGLGREFARIYAGRGCDLLLTARSASALEELAAELAREFGVEALTVALDFSRTDAAKQLVAFADMRGLRIDALVNNAGFAIDEPFVESDLAAQQALAATNMGALMELCHVFGGRMAARGEGKILNVASVAGFVPGPRMATYYASKAFVQSFTQALHTELRPHGVTVTALCPGPVRTEFWERAGASRTVVAQPTLPARTVARAACRALDRGRAVVSPGVLAKAVRLFARVCPLPLMRAIVSAIQKPWR